MFLNFFAGFAGYSLRIQCTECWATPVDSSVLSLFLLYCSFCMLLRFHCCKVSESPLPLVIHSPNMHRMKFPRRDWSQTTSDDILSHLSHLSCIMWAKVILWVCWCCSPVDGSLSCQLVSFAYSSLCYF